MNRFTARFSYLSCEVVVACYLSNIRRHETHDTHALYSFYWRINGDNFSVSAKLDSRVTNTGHWVGIGVLRFATNVRYYLHFAYHYLE